MSCGIATAGPRVAVAPSAEPAESTTLTSTITAPPAHARRHALYVEAGGKGGLWGLGYDLRLARWVSVGVVASYTVLDGQRVGSVTPHVALYPIGGAHHRLFVDAGPNVIRMTTPSPVPEWDGTSETGVGLTASTGYEYRNRFLFRAYGMANAGPNGVTPWFGMSVGWVL
ncbi:MAG: hypothetical protein H0T79_22990 [Deltaproteobacteria bacterium]|nr:hypothetical protein [Deltaproteobacteria bacterium]